MDYDKIMNYFNEVINGDLTIQSIYEIKKVYIYLSRAYRLDTMQKGKKKDLCAVVYQKYIDYVNDNVWSKLKEVLGLDDDIINRIFSFIKLIDNFEEMYFIDNTVLVKTNNELDKKLYSSPELDFKEITSELFIYGNEPRTLTNLIVTAINNAIIPFIDNKPESDNVVEYGDDGKINYLHEDINIYSSHSLLDILADNTGVIVTKVIVTYKDQLFCFDMKKRDDMIILSDNDVKVLSELLNKKNKTK